MVFSWFSRKISFFFFFETYPNGKICSTRFVTKGSTHFCRKGLLPVKNRSRAQTVNLGRLGTTQVTVVNRLV